MRGPPTVRRQRNLPVTAVGPDSASKSLGGGTGDSGEGRAPLCFLGTRVLACGLVGTKARPLHISLLSSVHRGSEATRLSLPATLQPGDQRATEGPVGPFALPFSLLPTGGIPGAGASSLAESQGPTHTGEEQKFPAHSLGPTGDKQPGLVQFDTACS